MKLNLIKKQELIFSNFAMKCFQNYYESIKFQKPLFHKHLSL